MWPRRPTIDSQSLKTRACNRPDGCCAYWSERWVQGYKKMWTGTRRPHLGNVFLDCVPNLALNRKALKATALQMSYAKSLFLPVKISQEKSRDFAGA